MKSLRSFGSYRWFSITIVLLFSSVCLAREVESPPFFAVPDGDSVYIVLGKVPKGTEGFNLYRKKSGEADFKLLNQNPIQPIRDPVVFRSVIGEDYDWVKRATRGENELQVLRRILRDPGTRVALSYASVRVGKALGMIYVDSDVTTGASYTYRVNFVNIEGKEFQSSEQTCVVRQARVPEPPFEVKAEPGDGKVKVIWKYKPLEPGFDYLVVGFNIYRRAQGEAEFRKVNPVLFMWQEDRTYRIDMDVTNGVGYTYYVTAVDLIGKESKPSNYADATPVDRTPPRIPEGVVAVASQDRIIVGWQMNLELDLSHYNVFRARRLDEEFKKINTAPVPGDLPYFEDLAVKAGKPFFYKIQAVDKNGNQSSLSSAVSALIEDRIPPKPPSSVEAKTKEHIVDLSWKYTPEEDLMGFYIYRGSSKDDLLRIVKDPVSGSSFRDKGYRDSGLRPGQKYLYAISAVDSAYNESEKVWTEIVIPDDKPPDPPLSLYATSTPDGRIEVLWQGSHSWDVKAYRIYKGEEGKQAQLLAEEDSTARRLMDGDVRKGVRYFYCAVAVDRAGNESQPTQKFYAMVTDADPPPPATGVKAIFREGQGVEISWNSVDVEDLAGYKVLRSNSASGIFDEIGVGVVKETRFLDKDGKVSNYYRVIAVDTSGNLSKRSEPVKPEIHQ